jgi:hypothetical protein
VEENETTPDGDIQPIEIPDTIAQWAAADADAQAQLLDSIFGELSTEEIDGILADIAAEVLLLGESRTPDNVDRMESLVDYLTVVEAEKGRREADAAALDARADEVLTRLGGEGDPTPEGDAGDPVVPEGEGEPAEPAIAATVTEPVARPTGTGLAQRIQQILGERDAAAAQTPTPAPTLPTGDALALQMLTPNGQRLRGQFVSTAQVANSFDPAMNEGEVIGSLTRLGEIIYAKTFRTERAGWAGLKDNRVTLATARIDFGNDRMLAEQDFQGNYAKLRAIGDVAQAVAASGGSCAPAAPRYEVDGTAVPHMPVEDNLPVYGAPRGSVTWVPGPDWLDMLEGIGTVTDAQDRAGYGSGSGEATPKPCVHAPCPDEETKRATAISHCIEFGNLTFDTWPEFVARLTENLMAAFARVKEVYYLDRIDEDSTTQTYDAATSSYGFARAVRHFVAEASHGYRKRNGMDVDATLDLYLPDFVQVGMLIDWQNDAGYGVEQFWRTFRDATASLESLGLNVTWYYDSASGEGQAFQDAIADGVADLFPTTAIGYLHAPGTFVRLDMGVLNVGIVRDSVLNETNDVQIFAEQFLEVAKFGHEAVTIEITGLCPNGEAPDGVTAITCA